MHADTDKGTATKWLIDRIKNKWIGKHIVSVGLGDSYNDISMLQVVDKPIIIKNKHHEQLLKTLRDKNPVVSAHDGPLGWAECVEEIVFSKEIGF